MMDERENYVCILCIACSLLNGISYKELYRNLCWSVIVVHTASNRNVKNHRPPQKSVINRGKVYIAQHFVTFHYMIVYLCIPVNRRLQFKARHIPGIGDNVFHGKCCVAFPRETLYSVSLGNTIQVSVHISDSLPCEWSELVAALRDKT